MKKNKKHIFFVLTIISLVLVFSGTRKASANSFGLVNAAVQLAVCGDNIKDHGEQCDNLDLGGKSCTDLGYSGGTLGCSASCDFDFSACTTSADVHSSVTLTPAADRTYILSDGLDSLGIALLQSFYESDLSLFLFSYPTTATSPSGQSLVGKSFNLIFVNDNGDNVHNLDKTSTITLSYADMDLGTTDESTLAPYRSEDGGTTWTVVPGYTLDRTAKTITFTTTKFSSFTIFGYPIVIHTTVVTTGGGGGGVSGGNWAPPKATPEEKKAILKVADFNRDGKVDVTDLSILLYYFEKTGDKIKNYDLNDDGRIDIVDVSIMLYYWEVTS